MEPFLDRATSSAAADYAFLITLTLGAIALLVTDKWVRFSAKLVWLCLVVVSLAVGLLVGSIVSLL